ncbi:FYDLN acid domain-containing protein [Acidocella sp.]|uniref:FYDLN acid domain-containing protein n=1 Tax=Acidocella sp. TaxID=50710 RepID=UPI00260E9E3E|nr:FYDLN acid domain-containing protein [Acidocella sp.]MDD2794409.1 FYDLN acid domain-containing protein [Acidocella sp.]
MAKPELGSKHTCVSCGARFFDLGKEPAVCPKCATEQPAEQPRLKRAAPLPEEVKKVIKPAAVNPDDVDVEVVDDGDDEDILEDDDLDDDADVLDADIDVQPESDDAER